MRIPPIYRVLPIVVLALLTLVAVLAPVKGVTQEWIPLMSGMDTGFLSDNRAVSILLGAGIIGAVLFSLYFLLRRSSALKFPVVSVIFLLIVSSIPSFVHFKTVYILLLLLIWTHFCLTEKQIFTAFMLLSVASLFYAPSIWLVPFSLVFIPFSGAPDSLKSFVKAIAGFLLPHIYMLVFRWMKFDDAGIYLLKFYESIIDVHFMERQLVLPALFMAVYLIYLVSRSAMFVMRSSASKLVHGVLKMQILSLVTLLPLYLCFDSAASPLLPIIAYPSAVLIAFYFSNFSNTKRGEAELVLLLLAIIINCVSHYI